MSKLNVCKSLAKVSLATLTEPTTDRLKHKIHIFVPIQNMSAIAKSILQLIYA